MQDVYFVDVVMRFGDLKQFVKIQNEFHQRCGSVAEAKSRFMLCREDVPYRIDPVAFFRNNSVVNHLLMLSRTALGEMPTLMAISSVEIRGSLSMTESIAL